VETGSSTCEEEVIGVSDVHVETWPEVWAMYWNPMEENLIRQWDSEFGNVFGVRPCDGSVKLNESEICKALRELGVSKKYKSFKPKIGEVIDAINVNRKKEIEETMGNDSARRKGTVACPYCMDKGYVYVPYVEDKVGNRRSWRFPKTQVWKGPHFSIENATVSMLDLEPHSKMTLPCLLCGKGLSRIDAKDIDRAKTGEILEKYKKWVLTLPDDCIRKPDILRGKFSGDLVRVTIPTKQEENDMEGW